jgi:3-oxoacyl-[acyl-carrier protein] reductase
MDLGLVGKVAVVTGGDSGIGKATAERLAREGAKVALIGKASEPLEQETQALKQFSEFKQTSPSCRKWKLRNVRF